MLKPEFFPWQIEPARQWLSQRSLAHAWLFHGLSGIGKRQYGLALAASLLCETPKESLACGVCQSCLWVRLGNHPDLMRIRSEAQAASEGLYEDKEEEGRASSRRGSSTKLSEIIKVDQIRALEPWYHLSTHRHGWRIVLIYPAQTLMAESANALLKSLEEPPPNTLFLLTTDSADRLLPTILSRCQKLKLTPPQPQVAVQWLQEQGLKEPAQWLSVAGGAVLKALELSQTLATPCPPWLETLVDQLAAQRPIEIAALADELAKEPTHVWLGNLQRVSIDLCLCSAGLKARYLTALEPRLKHLSGHKSLASWTQLQQWITQQMPLAHHTLNPKLFAHACLQRLTDTLT